MKCNIVSLELMSPTRGIRWVGNGEALLFTCCPVASRCASRRGRNVAICLTVKLLNATAAFIAARQFFRRHASFVPHRAHAPPDETTRRCARPARGIPTMRCARFMVLRCSGRRREPRSRIAWNLVSRSAISLRNARRHTYVSTLRVLEECNSRPLQRYAPQKSVKVEDKRCLLCMHTHSPFLDSIQNCLGASLTLLLCMLLLIYSKAQSTPVWKIDDFCEFFF